jgi:hypothetical protein
MTSDLLTGQKVQAYKIPCILAIKRVFVFLQADRPSKNNLVLPSLNSVLYPNKSCTGNRPSELSNTISTYALITAVPDPSYIVNLNDKGQYMKQLLPFLTSQMRIIIAQHKPYRYASAPILPSVHSYPRKSYSFQTHCDPLASSAQSLQQQQGKRTDYIVPRTEGVDFSLILVGLEALDCDLDSISAMPECLSTCFMCMAWRCCTDRDRPALSLGGEAERR